MQRLGFAPVNGCHRVSSEVVFGGIDTRRQGETVFSLVRRLVDRRLGRQIDAEAVIECEILAPFCAWPYCAANASADVVPANDKKRKCLMGFMQISVKNKQLLLSTKVMSSYQKTTE